MNNKKIIIATRGSDLALKQATLVKNTLLNHFPELAERIEIEKVTTSGDKITDRPLAEVGGKGLFVKEIDEQLIIGKANIAVHSLKDVPGLIPEELVIAAVLPREDPSDCLVSKKYMSFEELPEAATIGTSSVRRQAQILSRRPDIRIVQFRGNVPTRLQKLENGEVDATILAAAGLNRLELTKHITQKLSVQEFLPAIGQGAIAISARKDDLEAQAMLKKIGSKDDFTATTAERAIMLPLNASCTTPLAGHAVISGSNIHIKAMLSSTDGSRTIFAERFGFTDEAFDLGYEIGEELLGNGGELLYA